MNELIIVALAICGLLSHFLKKLWDIKQQTGQVISPKVYFIRNPYQSVFSVVMCISGVLMLWGSPELTKVTAFTFGYMSDSVASMIRQRIIG